MWAALWAVPAGCCGSGQRAPSRAALVLNPPAVPMVRPSRILESFLNGAFWGRLLLPHAVLPTGPAHAFLHGRVFTPPLHRGILLDARFSSADPGIVVSLVGLRFARKCFVTFFTAVLLSFFSYCLKSDF